jgi:hypothetical protein
MYRLAPSWLQRSISCSLWVVVNIKTGMWRKSWWSFNSFNASRPSFLGIFKSSKINVGKLPSLFSLMYWSFFINSTPFSTNSIRSGYFFSAKAVCRRKRSSASSSVINIKWVFTIKTNIICWLNQVRIKRKVNNLCLVQKWDNRTFSYWHTILLYIGWNAKANRNHF